MNPLIVSIISLIVCFLFFIAQKKNSWYSKFLFPVFFLYLGLFEAETVFQALLFGACVVFSLMAFTKLEQNESISPQMNYSENEFEDSENELEEENDFEDSENDFNENKEEFIEPIKRKK
jgi:predicted membrane protein